MDSKLLSLIDTAIQREEDAYTFYMGIYGKVTDPACARASNGSPARSRSTRRFW